MSMSNSQLIVPPAGYVSVCEQNGEILNVPASSLIESYYEGQILHQPTLSILQSQITTFPTISVTPESLRRSNAVGETAKSAFLEQKETKTQKVQSAWLSHGLTGALSELCNDEENEDVPSTLQVLCRYLLVGLRWISGMHCTLFPHLKLSHEELICEFASNRDWSNSPIRHFCWHPKAHKFAVAFCDDTIKIHYTNNPLVPILKHKLQKNVTVMEWKPLANSLLAVGTLTAIIIWNIDPKSNSTRPSTGAIQILSYSGHSPITSLAWNPQGEDILVASSALSSAIVVWNTSLAEYQVIQHVTACGGISRVLWSRDGSKVLAATPSSSLRIFETGMWTNERWSNLSGRVQCACWNPSGTILLFALVGDCHVYSLSFNSSYNTKNPTASSSNQGTVVLDLSSPDVESSESQPGKSCIHSMIWDETGERVAVTFTKDDPRHHLVALFSTTETSVFTISPRGYIQGGEDVDPVFIAFKPNYDLGACLTICWSDGKITYVPLYFARGSQTSAAPGRMRYNLSPRKAYHQHNMTLAANLGIDKTSIWSSKDDLPINRTVI